ncbi:MAG: hypothetical protein K6T59_06705 [Bryobacteraceae bacterium]|nr:hypothetical protein [Bryobacteraceae bacterium]
MLQFALLCVLESVSYTRKDGQYLRWDYRAGRRQGKKCFDKGSLPEFDTAISSKLHEIIRDMVDLQPCLWPGYRQRRGQVNLLRGSCLRILPTLAAASYVDAAQKLVFAKDRNPTVVIEPEPPKVIPPLPVAHGVVNFGDGPLVILSEKPGAPHKSYAPGEKVGDFRLLAVTREDVVFEWEGEKIRRKLEELVERRPQESPAAAEQPPQPAPAQAPQTTVVNPTGEEGFGPSIGNEIRACLPGDTSPPGTVRAGMRKVVTRTPFGNVCRWEPVQ